MSVLSATANAGCRHAERVAGSVWRAFGGKADAKCYECKTGAVVDPAAACGRDYEQNRHCSVKLLRVRIGLRFFSIPALGGGVNRLCRTSPL